MKRARILLRACRPRQWVKNVLVLAAPIAGGIAFQPRAVVEMIVAVIAFCMASSGIYLVNDAMDIEADRAHATKRHRPIASGELSVRAAWTAAAVLLPGGLVISALLNWQLLMIMAIYEVVQLWYCLGMKHEPVIELASVASGFLLRAIAGGVATHILLSQWFLIAAGFGSLFMAAGKRYSEIRLAQDTGVDIRPVLKHYTPTYLRFVDHVGRGAGHHVRAVGLRDAPSQPERVERCIHRPVCRGAAAVRRGRRQRCRGRTGGDRPPRQAAAASRGHLGSLPDGLGVPIAPGTHSPRQRRAALDRQTLEH